MNYDAKTSGPGLSRVRGALFGAAYGDALGYATEFIGVQEILKRWPPAGPSAPHNDPWLVSDDTQMMLAVGEALVQTHQRLAVKTSRVELHQFVEAVTEDICDHFIQWLDHPDNNRAPGNTCLRACRNIQLGNTWIQSTVAGSKGCGANMRVQPVGLMQMHFAAPRETRTGLAQLQAAITHGHPTAVAASALTTETLLALSHGIAPGELLSHLQGFVNNCEKQYLHTWLGDLWKRFPGQRLTDDEISSQETYALSGWNECKRVLNWVREAAIRGNRQQDPCIDTGDGWVAEEAWGTGLLCFLLFPEDPVAAIQRAAVTRGDSDSIACLAGAFAGAHLGFEAWPAEWADVIEYGDRLESLSQNLAQMHWGESLSAGSNQ